MTSVVSAMHVSSGCSVVTSSAYPGSQQGAAMDLAGRLVPSNYPLNGTVFGAGSKTPVFFAEGAAATGQQRGMVTARHLLLDAAAAMSPTTGKASATPIPGSAFAKVRLAEWWMFALDVLPCQRGCRCGAVWHATGGCDTRCLEPPCLLWLRCMPALWLAAGCRLPAV